MDMKENTVYLSTSSYNQIKSENQKFHMMIDRLMESSTLSDDKASVEFNPKLLSEVVHIIYPEAYKKRLSWLRGQDTREAMKRMQNED